MNALQTAQRAYDLASYGGASHDAVSAAFAELVEAKRAAMSPEDTITRLEHMARSHDACALRHDAVSAEFYGKAAFRRHQATKLTGAMKLASLELANGFKAQADAADACSVAEMAEAMRLRREAALIKHRIAEAKALAGVVQ